MNLLKSYLLNNGVKSNRLIVKSIKLRSEHGIIRRKSIRNRLSMLLIHILSLRNINRSYNKNFIAISRRNKNEIIEYVNRNHNLISFNFLVFDSKIRKGKKGRKQSARELFAYGINPAFM